MTQAPATHDVAGAARLRPRIMPAPAAVIDGFDLVITVRAQVVVFDDPKTLRLMLLEPTGVCVPFGRRQPPPGLRIGLAGWCNPLGGRHEDSCR